MFRGWGGGGCHRDGRWAEMRAKRAVVTRKPEEVLVGEPGKIVFVPMEV